MITVSCVEQVDFLIRELQPDCVVSISSGADVPAGIQHEHLNFADIDEPIDRNRYYAATIDDVNRIRSLPYRNTLIHCRQGHRRSPSAALILLDAIFPNQQKLLFDEIKKLAPYVDFNRHLLRLAKIDIEIGQRLRPPKDCYFCLDNDRLAKKLQSI